MLPGAQSRPRPAVSVGDFFRHLDQDFIGLTKVADEDFVYKCSDVLVQSALEVPIIVQWPEATVEFDFYSKLGDISFGVVFVAAPEEDCEVCDEDVVTIVETERYGCYAEPVTGRFSPPCEGVLFFIWDNAHDWTSVKKVTYTVRVHQPSFSLVDRVRCEAAREQLSPLVDALNDDHNRRDDARNAARNQAASASFLELQIEKLQRRLAQRQAQLAAVADEQTQLRGRVALAAAAGDGLRLRTLTRGLLLRVLSFLPQAADAPCARVSAQWAALCASCELHRGDDGFVDAALREQRRIDGGGEALSKAQRRALLAQLRGERSAAARAAAARAPPARHNRRIIRVPSSDATRPVRRSLSRTRSTSPSRSPVRASLSSPSSRRVRLAATRHRDEAQRRGVVGDAAVGGVVLVAVLVARVAADSSAARGAAADVAAAAGRRAAADGRDSDDEPNVRRVGFTATAASRLRPTAAAAAPTSPVGRDDRRRDEAKDPAPAAPRVHRKPKTRELDVPPELRGRVVSLGEASRLLPSLTSHPHLLQDAPPARGRDAHVAGPPARLKADATAAAADADERRRKQLRDFVVHGAQRVEQLATERRRLKRLIRSWQRVEAQLRGGDAALVDADGPRP
eukprot:gene18175-13050_t